MLNIIQFFVTNWRLSFIVTIFIFLSGIIGLLTLQRESFPPVDFAKVTVTTVYPGSTSQEVEEKITIPIENELRGIEGIKDVKSTSQNEQSKIEIRIDIDDPSVVTKDVVADIQRAVDRVQNLPSDILERPRIVEVNAKEIPVVELAITGPNENRERDKHARALQSLLEDIKGVANVRLVGYNEKEFQVLLNPFKLQQYYVGIPEIRAAIAARISDTPAGYIRGPEQNQMVRIKAKVEEATELNKVPVRTGDSGSPIYIENLGRAVETKEEGKVITSLNGEEATLLVVVKKASADAIQTVEKAKTVIDTFSKTLDPKFQIKIYNNESSRVQRRIGIVSSNAVQGFLLVLLVTFFFLPAKLSVMISLSLPISLFGSIYFMQQLGANFNLITMLGLIIALGMLVDNSVVVGELYANYRKDGVNPKEAAIKSTHRFWIALFCSVLTTIAAFTPMLVTKGVMGQFIRWIPIVVNLALFFSLIDSFFLLPARLQFILKKGSSGDQSEISRKWFTRVESVFEKSVRWFISNPMKSTLGFVGLFILSFVVTITGNRFELFPKEGVEFYIGRVELPVQTPVQVTHQEIIRISQEIKTLLGKENIEAIVGRAGIQQAGVGDPLEKNDEHFGMITIKIPVEVAAKQNPNDVLDRLKKINPGKAIGVNFESLANGPPVGKPLNLILRSENEANLLSVIKDLSESLSSLKGLENLTTNQVRSGPEILVLPKPASLNYVKLTEQDLGLNLRTAYQGLIVGKFYDQGDDFVLRIRFDEPFRKDQSSLQSVKVLNQRNLLIDLRPLADFKIQEGPPILKRYDFKRAITLTAETNPKVLTSVELNKKAANKLKELQKQFPDVSGVFGGEAESTKESVQSLFLALILALIGIFGILVFAFNSFLKPFLVISSIPLGLIGINLAFFIHQRPLSFLALIGTIGLAGVIVNSAIILVSAIDEYFEANPESKHSLKSYIEAITLVTKDRLRPVLITSLTTVAGLVPTAYGIGGYDSTLVPLTLAMGWGLFAGTLLSLVWIPIGYRIIDSQKKLSS
jgi:multidrug efflux pump subunit AcrB